MEIFSSTETIVMGKLPLGKLSFGKMCIWEVAFGKLSLGKLPLGKCLRESTYKHCIIVFITWMCETCEWQMIMNCFYFFNFMKTFTELSFNIFQLKRLFTLLLLSLFQVWHASFKTVLLKSENNGEDNAAF